MRAIIIIIVLSLQISSWSEQVTNRIVSPFVRNKTDNIITATVNQIQSVSNQVAYLANIANGVSNVSSRARTTAILLLVQSKSKEAIDVLLQNLLFEDEVTGDHPAQDALIDIGPQCATNIMDYIIKTNKLSPAVIKASDTLWKIYYCKYGNEKEYIDFVDRYKKQLSPDKYEYLRTTINR